ncbi:YqcC family protein [Vibrio aquaticus]|uniref:YqcC family protein n=1 Tax=Vibrio aquaticus TaxID=2496559 RepID=A0A432CUU6_9VIBR|nr:YqcC family protein [Vibrio aquaticus]RTZ15390.1 YqcC family protein [Vibrio aquaticus]
MTKQKQLVELVDALEQEMRSHHLWKSTQPSAEALSSTQPFAIDTLEPQEWLQWVFIAKVRVLIAANQMLPSGFAIAPYFEECWKERAEYVSLIKFVQQIDKVCSDA